MLFAALLALAGVAHAHAQDPAPGTPERQAQHLDNFERSRARTLDYASNPEYQERMAPLIAAFAAQQDSTYERVTVDPFLAAWDPERGKRTPFEFANRYGATLRGHLFRAHSTKGRRKLPTVLIIPGFGGYEQVYWGLAQGLAEAGYLVAVVDPQGQGQSDVDPQPREKFCDPNGEWREPQEMGLREHGDCAGHYPATPPPTLSTAGMLLRPGTTGSEETFRSAFAETEDLYVQLRQNTVFAAFDTIDWLLSGASPVRRVIDRDRVAVAGHSLGANGALLAANGDPEHRFAAAVVWDGYGGLAPARPRVPTMFQSSDLEDFGPFRYEVDPELTVPTRQARAFADAGVNTMMVPLRGSTHFEWTYIPERELNPVTAPNGNASRYGERIALYYTRAWLDRHMRRGRRAKRAGRRLLACTYDGSVDGSSIGVGSADASGKNVPYRIAGLTTREQIAYRLRSSWRLGRRNGEDLRHNCR
jgi:dienelactone hydrolase